MRRRNSWKEVAGGEAEEHKLSELGPGLAHEIEGFEKPSELETGRPFHVILRDEGARGRLGNIVEVG
jgi:hypothetical protein